MTDIVIDAALREKLHNLDEPIRVWDESGRVLGFFHPVDRTDESGFKSPISDEELERRCQNRTGRPLSEIMKRLEQL